MHLARPQVGRVGFVDDGIQVPLDRFGERFLARCQVRVVPILADGGLEARGPSRGLLAIRECFALGWASFNSDLRTVGNRYLPVEDLSVVDAILATFILCS